MDESYILVRAKQLLGEAYNSRGICQKRPIGIVIRMDDGAYILGWNGAPNGIEHKACIRKNSPSGKNLEDCPTIHAERRAISNAAKEGVSIRGATLYMGEWFPCADCAKSIIEAGIARIVTPDQIYDDKGKYSLVDKLRGQPYNFELAERMLREAEVELVVEPRIKPIKPKNKTPTKESQEPNQQSE